MDVVVKHRLGDHPHRHLVIGEDQPGLPDVQAMMPANLNDVFYRLQAGVPFRALL
ncbi:MAG: hypothetical protein ACE5F6_03785 [Anaerolineae bacterium]